MADRLTMQKPLALEAGATLGVFTPSEPLTEDRRQMVAEGVRILEDAVFKVKTGRRYEARSHHTAGSPLERVADVHELLADDDVRALITSWGGKSCCQLLPLIDYGAFRKCRKPLIGFSDGGVLVNAIVAKAGLVSFYGPNVVGKLSHSMYADLRQLLSGRLRAGTNLLADATGEPSSCVLSPGAAEGHLVGGNLSTFSDAIMGTDYAPPFEDWILIWESGPRTSQALDTLLWSVKLSCDSHRIRGMVIGDCRLKEDARWGTQSLREIVSSVFGDDVPILHAPVFGHRDLPNPAFPIGSRVVLDTSATSLVLEESAVEE
ncbi:MAG: LD-carboxypeptidase [Candidatus Eisenbacteria bacterium]